MAFINNLKVMQRSQYTEAMSTSSAYDLVLSKEDYNSSLQLFNSTTVAVDGSDYVDINKTQHEITVAECTNGTSEDLLVSASTSTTRSSSYSTNSVELFRRCMFHLEKKC